MAYNLRSRRICEELLAEDGENSTDESENETISGNKESYSDSSTEDEDDEMENITFTNR